MLLSDFGIDGGLRKTLFVLGAGASRGASFVTDQTKVLPPLDMDFFQQLSRMPSSAASDRLLQFVRREYGHELGLSMEQFFSEADYTNRFHEELNVDRGPSVRRYNRALDAFLEVLPKMLISTTSEACEYHRIIAESLHAQDCIVSFNYDCLVDSALRDYANVRWDPDKSGYGFDVSSGAAAWRVHTRGHPVQTSIRLLKMHGSMNWTRTAAGNVRLVHDIGNVATLKDAIIPPTWFKDLTTYPYDQIWKRARKEIRSSRIVVVVGYSVPPTDLFSRSLFKVEAGSKDKREKLDLLVLVNPDRSSRQRFLDTVRDGLEPSTRILEYDKLQELAAVIERGA